MYRTCSQTIINLLLCRITFGFEDFENQRFGRRSTWVIGVVEKKLELRIVGGVQLMICMCLVINPNWQREIKIKNRRFEIIAKHGESSSELPRLLQLFVVAGESRTEPKRLYGNYLREIGEIWSREMRCGHPSLASPASTSRMTIRHLIITIRLHTQTLEIHTPTKVEKRN